jgi:hypothetical protein
VIHHASIPAAAPAHVARVLAELLGGKFFPFKGAGGFIVVAGDAHGTMIEVYAQDVRLTPGEGDRQVRFERQAAAPEYQPFHLLLSVPLSREAILTIGDREGWRTNHFWRGSQSSRDFELVEMWLENRVMLELLSPEMVPTYLSHMRLEALEAMEAQVHAR